MKKLLVTLLKIGLSAAIIAVLAFLAVRKGGFTLLADRFRDPGFDWALLAAACACCAAAVVTTLVRWWLLVRALDVPLPLGDAFRLGFLGYLFNLAPLGIVGGDLLKAVMLAHHQGRKAQAFASVAVDRVLGLHILFVVASAGILLTGFTQHESADIRYICAVTLVFTVCFTLALGCLFIPGLSGGRMVRAVGRLPHVGRPLEHLIEAVLMYRRKPGTLVAAAVMSVFCQSLFVVGIYLITLGIYGGNVRELSLSGMFVVLPLSESTGVIPLMMGPFETVLDFLYGTVFLLDKSQGFVVALGYRLTTLLIAAVGIAYYIGSRREVSEVMHEAEEEG